MNKKEYKAMKREWALSVNNKDNHPYKHPIYGNKISGKITSVHYLLYNLLRQMPAERGFEPVGQGYEDSWKTLKRMYKYRPDDLLFPFNGTVTIEHLEEL